MGNPFQISAPSSAGESPRRRLKVAGRCLCRLAVLAWLLLTGGIAPAQPTASEDQIKAAFLVKFAHYLEWPATAFAAADDPVVIGLLGTDTFGPEFDASLRAFKVAGRPVRVRRLQLVAEAKGCHLLYISPSENERLKSILAALRGQPIFSAGDQEDFLKLGGVLRFWRKGERVAFQINLAALRETKITAQPRLLQLSDDPARPQ
ncbi:MAG: YfiR family protein [Limisphaerales bacterium]